MRCILYNTVETGERKGVDSIALRRPQQFVLTTHKAQQGELYGIYLEGRNASLINKKKLYFLHNNPQTITVDKTVQYVVSAIKVKPCCSRLLPELIPFLKESFTTYEAISIPRKIL